METSKDIKGQGAKRAFFGINMSKNENPSKQNDLLVLPEHANFWAIKKLCSFSWTFPENSRWPGSFYFYMMFMIPEVLVNFAMKNLLKMF
jgi:hypothetical protein